MVMLQTTPKEPTVAFRKGPDLASAATLTITTDDTFFDVTGTTTVTAISSRPAGPILWLQFDGILTLTYNATRLILQGSVDYTTAAGDVVGFVSEGGGNWRELTRRGTAAGAVTRAGGQTTEATTTSTTAVDLTVSGAISIPVGGVQGEVRALIRKTSGSARFMSVGLTFNATQVRAPTTVTDSADNTGSSWLYDRFYTFLAGYSDATTLVVGYHSHQNGTSAVVSHLGIFTALDATITSITIRGLVGADNITMGADEMHIYTFSTS